MPTLILTRLFRTLIISFTTLLSTTSFGNEIDDLKDDSSVITFFRKIYNVENIDGYSISGQAQLINMDSICNDVVDHNICRILVDSLNLKSWYKTDFDDDSQTDLIIHVIYLNSGSPFLFSRHIFAIRAMQNNHYEIKLLKHGYGTINLVSDFIRPIQFNGMNYITSYKTLSSEMKPDSLFFISDTLVFKFGGFVEYSYTQDTAEIVKISLSIKGYPFGSFKDYDIEISLKSRKYVSFASQGCCVPVEKISYDFTRTQIDILMSLVQYLNLKAINIHHFSFSTDLERYATTINYSDGSKTVIDDYGGAGTFGLKRLYELLLNPVKKDMQN